MPGIRSRREIQFRVGPGGCHICTSHCADDRGYPQIRPSGRGGRCTRLTRVVYEAVYGPIPAGQVVRHSCDNPGCINIDHLLLGTQQDNVDDRETRGRGAKGEKHGRAKLTVENVREIRASTATRAELAAKFGVSRSAIQMVQNRKNWQHV